MDGSDRRRSEFDEVFRRECRRVVRAAYLVAGDWEVAQEIAQDCFAELYARWTKVGDYDDVGAWLRRIAVRRAVRTRHRARRAAELGPDRSDAAAASGAGAGDASTDLWNTLQQLPRQQRAAIVLHYLDDLPVRDIAELIGCSPATVKVHLHRGRSALRRELHVSYDGGVDDG